LRLPELALVGTGFDTLRKVDLCVKLPFDGVVKLAA
jgi:hypothetical protein